MKTDKTALAALVLSPALVTGPTADAEALPRLGHEAEAHALAQLSEAPDRELGPEELLEIAGDLEATIQNRAHLQELRFGLRKAIALACADDRERRVFCFSFAGEDEPRWIGMNAAREILAATEQEIAELDQIEQDLAFEMIASVREVAEGARALSGAREKLSAALAPFFA
ncbi:MAG: hypothetical protein QNK05_05695 [Myxococcota bacterium]|nr:hypothetical protein [Myxococcota bacterium]